MIVTLTGPSCAGKTTLEAMLVERGLARAISTTTRPMREGEVDGESYNFISREAFETNNAAGCYVEHVEFGGHYYGLSVPEIGRLHAQNKPIVVVCEPVGQKQIAAWCKANGHRLFSVFVDNPTEVIAERFLNRVQQELTSVGTKHWEIGDKIKTNARRLKEMMETEAEWRREAWRSIPSLYNMRLCEFNAGNDKLCADVIAAVALGGSKRVL